MPAEEPRVGRVEADGGGVVRRPLVDHVDAVEDHDAAVAVGDPAAFVGEGRGRARGGGGTPTKRK
jgi:hypothetical protein